MELESSILGYLSLNDQPSFERISSPSYKNLSSRFILPLAKNFTVQYNSIYFVRLLKSRQLFHSNMTAIPLNGILEIKKKQSCWLIGLIYREMKGKSNLLQKINDGENLKKSPDPSSSHEKEKKTIPFFASDEDIFFLEDENGKLILDVGHFKNELCSGVIAAVRGIFDGKIFKLDEIVFLWNNLGSMDLSVPKHLKENKNLMNYVNDPKGSNDRWIAITSGLNLGKSIEKEEKWMAEFLRGNLGGDKIKNVSLIFDLFN